MTDKEKAIVMAHTGICMLAGNKFQIFHKYVEDIMNRPIMTHEIGLLADEIKEKSKADFMALCANENNVEEEQELILDKIKKVAAKWKADSFSDGFSWDCMQDIADIIDKAESEDKK